MKVFIEQTFPLGRFHATPWKAFPYDDPYGEWPPSPWRLLRAVIARSYQLERETGTPNNEDRARLVTAFAGSLISWHLPEFSWRGPGVRQYQPAEFKWGYPQPTKLKLIGVNSQLRDVFKSDFITVLPMPKGEKRDYTEVECFNAKCRSLKVVQVFDKKLLKMIRDHGKQKHCAKRIIKRYPPDFRSYNTTKVQDSFWLTPPEFDPIVWILKSAEWSEFSRNILSKCLARMTYFGRAESITEIRCVEKLPPNVDINCVLENTPSSGSVPVLALTLDATLKQVQAVTDDPSTAKSTVPPGAQWLYAKRPARPPVKLPPPKWRSKKPVQFLQFAIGTRVSPPRKSVVVLTQRFRGRVIREFLGGSWQRASMEQREAARLLTGKEADGKPLQDHQHPHVRFGILFDKETNKATRLIVWRDQPFTDAEQRAILSAAEQELQIMFSRAGRNDPWTVRLVPLDSQVPPPRGFDAQTYGRWETAIPYVPPRHMYDRQGRVKPEETPEEQLQLELKRRGFDTSKLMVEVDHGMSEWIRVHRPRRSQDDPTNTDKRGYHVSLTFETPVRGPIAAGHSSHFGLGLFVPIIG